MPSLDPISAGVTIRLKLQALHFIEGRKTQTFCGPNCKNCIGGNRCKVCQYLKDNIDQPYSQTKPLEYVDWQADLAH